VQEAAACCRDCQSSLVAAGAATARQLYVASYFACIVLIRDFCSFKKLCSLLLCLHCSSILLLPSCKCQFVRIRIKKLCSSLLILGLHLSQRLFVSFLQKSSYSLACIALRYTCCFVVFVNLKVTQFWASRICKWSRVWWWRRSERFKTCMS
jgi:hypothetical protein